MTEIFNVYVLEKTLESPLDCEEIKPVNPKGNPPWVFIGRTDVEAKVWPPDVKSRLIGKDHDTGKDWCRRSKGQQRMRWLDGITDSMDMSLNKLQKMVKDREAWGVTIHRVAKSLLSNWACMQKALRILLMVLPGTYLGMNENESSLSSSVA